MNWISLGLKAIRLGFDENEQLDSTKSDKEINRSKELFYECIKLKPEEAWPYIKLADLINDKKEKIRIYQEGLKAEENNDFIKARLYDLLINR